MKESYYLCGSLKGHLLDSSADRFVSGMREKRRIYMYLVAILQANVTGISE